jgi:hypothetical protein
MMRERQNVVMIAVMRCDDNALTVMWHDDDGARCSDDNRDDEGCLRGP